MTVLDVWFVSVFANVHIHIYARITTNSHHYYLSILLFLILSKYIERVHSPYITCKHARVRHFNEQPHVEWSFGVSCILGTRARALRTCVCVLKHPPKTHFDYNGEIVCINVSIMHELCAILINKPFVRAFVQLYTLYKVRCTTGMYGTHVWVYVWCDIAWKLREYAYTVCFNHNLKSILYSITRSY